MKVEAKAFVIRAKVGHSTPMMPRLCFAAARWCWEKILQ
jgi:hypothetical protein